MQNFKKTDLYKFKESFKIFDIRQTGMINQEDLAAVLAMLHCSPLKRELKQKCEQYATSNGKIKYKDFLQIAWELKHRQDKEIVLLEAFENLMDETNTYITVDRLKEVLTQKGEVFTNEEMDLFIQEADPHKTGKVVYKDFIKVMLNQQLMKIFIILILNIFYCQVPQNSSKYPMVSSDKKTITATTSFFDPKQEENVILRRQKRKGQINSIQEVINNMNNSLGLLKSKIKNRVNQMNDIIDSSLAYKEKHNLTVSNLNLNQIQKIIKFQSMKNKLSKNGSSFSLKKISSDDDLRKLEDQQRQTIKQKLRIRRIDSNQNIVRFKFFKPIEQFKELGAGIYYYFYFIKFFMIIFAIISLLSIIGISTAITGNGLEQFKEDGFFLKTTISNSHATHLTNEEIQNFKNLNEQQKNDYFDEKNSTNTLQFYILMTSDFFISLCFLIAIYAFQILSIKKVNSIDIKRPSARHYAIQVDNLPKDNITKQEIKQFFEQFHLVKSVSFSYKFGENFQTLIDINKTKEKIKNFLKKDQDKFSNKNIKKRTKLYEQLKSQIKKIHKENNKKIDLTNFENFQIKSAFVIFNKSQAPQFVYNKLKQAYKKTFFQKIFCQKKFIHKKFLFRSKLKLKISQPDHPGNFHWENVQYTKQYRRKRLALLYCTIFFIIAISFLINLFLTAFTSNYEGQKCEGVYQRDKIDINIFSKEMNEYIYCYCAQFPFYYLFKKEHESFNVCEKEYLTQIQALIIDFAIAAVISIVNMVIQSVIFKMVKSIKYSTLTQTVIKKINFSLLAEYCNTAFVLTLIYKTTFDLSLPEFFNTVTGSDFFKLNQTPQFNRFWYILVAKKLFIPFLLLCFNPHTSELILCFFKSLIADIRSKNISNKKKFLEVCQLPTFDLSDRFKNLLKLVIVCFTFSSGIPLFNIFIFFGLLFTFIFHKIILINYSSKVPPYSIEIIKSIFKVLKLSLLMHLFFSMLFFSDYEIFPSQNNFFIDIGVGNNTENEFFIEILEKIYQVFPIFCLFILTLVCIIFEVFIVGIFKKIIEYFTKRKIQTIESEKTYEQVKKKLKQTAILDYQILSNPRYENIINFKRTDLQMLKSMIVNKSLGQIIKLYSKSHQNLEKITTLEQNCLQVLNSNDNQGDLENINISDQQNLADKNLQNLQQKNDYKQNNTQNKLEIVQSSFKEKINQQKEQNNINDHQIENKSKI